jgi:hypothetical protein
MKIGAVDPLVGHLFMAEKDSQFLTCSSATLTRLSDEALTSITLSLS